MILKTFYKICKNFINVEVAYMVSEYDLKTDVIVTAILHDIVEDTEVTAGMILDNFGRRIEAMVDMLTRDRPDGTKLSVETILVNAHSKNDREVLLIKLIDRLHNMYTIGAKTAEKRKKTVNETINKFIILSLYCQYNKIEKDLSKICRQYINCYDNQLKIKKIFSFSNNGFFVFPVVQNEINQMQSPY